MHNTTHKSIFIFIISLIVSCKLYANEIFCEDTTASWMWPGDRNHVYIYFHDTFPNAFININGNRVPFKTNQDGLVCIPQRHVAVGKCTIKICFKENTCQSNIIDVKGPGMIECYGKNKFKCLFKKSNNP